MTCSRTPSQSVSRALPAAVGSFTIPPRLTRPREGYPTVSSRFARGSPVPGGRAARAGRTPRRAGQAAVRRRPGRGESLPCVPMTKWEYVTVPLLTHATKQILDNWGDEGWELVAVVPGPNPEQLVAYMKRPKQ
ncbi:hypothetical protein TBS_20120 [Thermobispora bispora]